MSKNINTCFQTPFPQKARNLDVLYYLQITYVLVNNLFQWVHVHWCNHKYCIHSSNDLVYIMNFGNHLYSRPISSEQSMLDADCQLEYSESLSGINLVLYIKKLIEWYSHCTSLENTFQSLLSDNHSNFILTIGAIEVAILAVVMMILG